MQLEHCSVGTCTLVCMSSLWYWCFEGANSVTGYCIKLIVRVLYEWNHRTVCEICVVYMCGKFAFPPKRGLSWWGSMFCQYLHDLGNCVNWWLQLMQDIWGLLGLQMIFHPLGLVSIICFHVWWIYHVLMVCVRFWVHTYSLHPVPVLSYDRRSLLSWTFFELALTWAASFTWPCPCCQKEQGVRY